jgi:hypothetical protein
MINEEHADHLMGRDMLDRDGNRIGQITQVFVDDRTGEPTWVTVKTGWFGLSQSFVPLHKVLWAGEQVQAAYDTATVKDAPRFATDEPLTVQDEDTLHAHYGLSDAATQLHHPPRPGDPDTGPLNGTTGNAQPVATGSRGRLRRYEPPSSGSSPDPPSPAGRPCVSSAARMSRPACGRCMSLSMTAWPSRPATTPATTSRSPNRPAWPGPAADTPCAMWRPPHPWWPARRPPPDTGRTGAGEHRGRSCGPRVPDRRPMGHPELHSGADRTILGRSSSPRDPEPGRPASTVYVRFGSRDAGNSRCAVPSGNRCRGTAAG